MIKDFPKAWPYLWFRVLSHLQRLVHTKRVWALGFRWCECNLSGGLRSRLRWHGSSEVKATKPDWMKWYGLMHYGNQMRYRIVGKIIHFTSCLLHGLFSSWSTRDERLEKKSDRRETWTHKEIKSLIDIWFDGHIQEHLSMTHKNSCIYALFSKQLREKGYLRTVEQYLLALQEDRRLILNDHSGSFSLKWRAMCHLCDWKKSWSSFGVAAANYVRNQLFGENDLYVQCFARWSKPWAQCKADPPWLSKVAR